jgi:hypothetical protein
MSAIKGFLFLFFHFGWITMMAQSEDSLAMPLILDREENVAYDQIPDQLGKRYNLNAIDLSQMLELPFVTFLDVQCILNYRHRHGKFIHPLELFQIPGISEQTKSQLYPHIEVHSEWGMSGQGKAQHVLSVRWKRYSNFNLPRTKGLAPWSELYRYSGVVSPAWKWGMLVTKDPGETWKRMPYLFKSGFVQWTSFTGKWKVIAGDFTAKWGQGLSIQGGFLNRPSFQMVSLIQGPSDIRPYTSTLENLRNQGVVLKYKGRVHSSLIGCSHRWLHGKLDSTGYFRESSTTVFSDSSSLKIWRKGQDFSIFVLDNWKFKTHNIGGGVVRTFDPSKFSWRKTTGAYTYCFEWNQQKDNRHVFLEGRVNVASWQWVQGGLIQLHPKFSLGWRSDGTWNSLNGKTVSSDFRVQGEWLWNEQWGLYWGVSSRKRIESKIALSFLENQHFLQLNWTPRRHHKWYYRILLEKEQQWQEGAIVYDSRYFKQLIHRLDGQWKVNDYCVIHQRIEKAIDSRFSAQSGYAFLEADIHPMSAPIQFIVRYLYFDSQEWEMRRYVQERGVTGSYLLSQLYGTGSRGYFILKWKKENFQIQMKYSRSVVLREVRKEMVSTDFTLYGSIHF